MHVIVSFAGRTQLNGCLLVLSGDLRHRCPRALRLGMDPESHLSAAPCGSFLYYLRLQDHNPVSSGK